MPHPLTRGTAPLNDDADETAANEHAPLSLDRNEDRQQDAGAFPLAYTEPGEEPAPPAEEAAALEASMMNDLEAVASAFWMELGPGLAPSDTDSGSSDEEEWPPAEPTGLWDDRVEPTLDGVVGPIPRRAVIDFRPPRAHRKPATEPGTDIRAVKEYVEPADGAFANDLAARNKEFYELLNAAEESGHKIPIPVAAPRIARSGPGFQSILPAGAPAFEQVVQEISPRRNGYARQALAVGIVVLAIGAGGAFIAARSVGMGEPALAAAVPDEADSVSVSAKDESSIVKASAPPAASIVAPTAPAEAEPPVAVAAQWVDPGTLATPPLYESEATKTAPDSAASSSDAVTPRAPITVRTETIIVPPALPPSKITSASDADGTAAADAATTSSLDLRGSTADGVATQDPAPAPAEAKTKRPEQAAAKPEKAKAKKTEVTAAEPAADREPAGNSKLLRISSGPATVTMSVNMRGGPDNGARVVKVLRAGTRVEIVSCKFWCEVIASGDRGYVYQRYIDRGAGPNAAAEPTAAKRQERAEAMPVDDHQPLNLLWLGQTKQ